MENNNDFLPSGYVQPISGGNNYMKIKQGENKFRILSKPIVGWLDWQDKKPLRFDFKNKPNAIDPTKPVKHFWAFVVWNYNDKAINILEITQSSIQQAITALTKDDDWGSPFGYDIKIVRTGEKMETTYTVNPVPHKPITDDVKKAYFEKPVILEKLFKGEDPFSATHEEALMHESKDVF